MKKVGQVDMGRVKRVLIEATGPNKQFTRRGLSLAAGLGDDGVRNILSGRSGNPRAATLQGLADALGRDISIFFRDEDASDDTLPTVEFVEVIGTVAAGVWREHNEWSDSHRYKIAVGPTPVPHAKRFALRLEGLSMNRLFASGTVLDCLRVSTRLQPQIGDLVIVERSRHDLYEMTCKRLARGEGGAYELHAESTEPEFQAPIPLGEPDPNNVTQDGLRVIGIVIGSYQSLFQERLRR